MRSSAFAILLVTGVAHAGTVAQLREDVDGNGSPDVVELRDDGTLHVEDGAKADVKVAPTASKGKLAVARLAGGAQIVVDVTTGQTREGVVLDRKGGWHVVTRFPLGGVGLDREYGVEVDATPTGVYRYQTRGDVTRCDGVPGYLFGEKLDGAAFKRLDKLPSGVPATAQPLPAKLDTAAAPAPLVFQAKAASHRAGATDAGQLAIPGELGDGKLETQWREDLATGGEGQFFTFRARIDGQRGELLRIVPGDPTSAARAKAAGRPRALAIVSKQGAWRFEIPDGAGEPLGAAYTVQLPPGIGDCATVIIETTQGRGATTIAELAIYAEGERGGGGEALIARVIASGNSDPGAAQTLARRGAAAVAAIDAELAKTTDAGARRRLIAVLVKIVDPAAAASLVKAASEGWVRDRDLLDLIEALGKNQQYAALKDLATKGGLPIGARVAAAKQIKPVGPGFTLLVELAGQGPRELRKETIERLALAPVSQLIEQATAIVDPRASGDLWRAATRGARTQQAARAELVTAMQGALGTVTDYERRYRLIDGIATHGDAAAIAALADTLRTLPTDASTAALRQVAIRGIASTPRAEAAPLVVNLTRDPDPGVRIAALAALASAETDRGGPWHSPDGPDAIDRVIQNGMYDGWPEVRRRAAMALGGRCMRPGPAKVLFEAVSTDKDLTVRGEALVALVGCKATGVDELLPFVWNSSKQPLPLRERAVGLVVLLGDGKLAQTMVKQFAKWRGEALESRDALTLAIAGAATLGLTKPPGAAQVLLDALDDSAFPELVGAAALALGELGPACPAAAKTKLGAIARSDSQAAVAAKRAHARCGK